VYCHRFRRLL